MNEIKTSEQFVRIVSRKYFMELVKEAVRVGYILEGEKDFFQIRDDETGDLVFAGLKHPSGNWIATFSTVYWQEPELS